jgi:uncharacterized protein YecE (DUF72 family)
MNHVACSGFPVPVSRYFADLDAVEVSETELGLVGEGTLRRYRREAPKSAVFSVLAPKMIGEAGFAHGRDRRDLVLGIGEIAKKLGACAVVFGVPEGTRATKETLAAAAALVRSLPKGFPLAVLDIPGADIAALGAAIDPKRAAVAYDALEDAAPPGRLLRYVRMPGPAGRRSRYDEPSIARLAAHVALLPEAFVVFRNQDMLVNAKALRAALAPPAPSRPATAAKKKSAPRAGARDL